MHTHMASKRFQDTSNPGRQLEETYSLLMASLVAPQGGYSVSWQETNDAAVFLLHKHMETVKYDLEMTLLTRCLQ